MPTYEYLCRSCEHRFEKFQSFSARPLRTCPECGEKELQKVIFASGVVFKGSGFYVTDSRAKGPSASRTEGGSETKATKKKEDTTKAKQESSSSTSSDD